MISAGTEGASDKSAELLHWWHCWQMQMLRQEADYIRNDLLQEVFAIRRRLEADFEEGDRPLARLNQLYASLEQLSDRLESPYGQEDLPLALHHAVKPWQPHLPITLDLPQRWDREGAIQVRLLIAVVNALCLTLVASGQRPQTYRLRLTESLTRSVPTKEMSITLSYCDLPPPTLMASVTAELTPLLKTFQLLTQGSYAIDRQAHTWACRLRCPRSLPSTALEDRLSPVDFPG